MLLRVSTGGGCPAASFVGTRLTEPCRLLGKVLRVRCVITPRFMSGRCVIALA